MYNEQACNELQDTWNTQDVVFDLDNCLQERSIRDDNKNDYIVGESKNVLHPSINFKQLCINGDIYNNTFQSCQDRLISYLKGNVYRVLNA